MRSPTALMQSHKSPCQAWGDAEPTSPADAPTTSSLEAHKQPHIPMYGRYSRYDHLGENIKPLGQGHQFSYQPSLDPDTLTLGSPSPPPPPWSESSCDVVEKQAHGRSSYDSDYIGRRYEVHDSSPGVNCEVSESELKVSIGPHLDVDTGDCSSAVNSSVALSTTSEASLSSKIAGISSSSPRHYTESMTCGILIEELDCMDSESEALEVLMPTEIESARSRSRPRAVLHLDKDMMAGLRNLHCSNESSEDEDPSETLQEKEFRERQAELRRLRRASTSSSIGKRTHSEMSDSEDDNRDVLDVNDVESCAKRMRKRLNRGSLLFHDTLATRIDELDEPDSSEDEDVLTNALARELPFWESEIMEITSE